MRSFGAVIHAGEDADGTYLRSLLERRHPDLGRRAYVLTIDHAEYRRAGHVRYHVSVEVGTATPAATQPEPRVRTITLPLPLRPPLGMAELDTVVPAALARACPDAYWPADEIDSSHDGATLQLRLALPSAAGEAPIDELALVRALRDGVARLRGARYPDR